eukprot:8725804-Lingulodinium_polyedra.AAC.1
MAEQWEGNRSQWSGYARVVIGLFRRCLDDVRAMLGRCSGDARAMLGLCSGNARAMFGLCFPIARVARSPERA